MRRVPFTVSTSLKNETSHHEESSFHCVILVKNEIVHHEDSSFTVSTSLKNETSHHEDGSFPVSTSLKNETNPLLFNSSLSSHLVNQPSFHPPSNNQ